MYDALTLVAWGYHALVLLFMAGVVIGLIASPLWMVGLAVWWWKYGRRGCG